MLGIEFLWGGPVQLETSDAVVSPAAERRQSAVAPPSPGDVPKPSVTWRRFVYTMEERVLSRAPL
jgi:stage V sporulation protein R